MPLWAVAALAVAGSFGAAAACSTWWLARELNALRAEVQRLRVQNARLVDPVSVNAAAAIVSDASGPLADENAAAWLGMSA